MIKPSAFLLAVLCLFTVTIDADQTVDLNVVHKIKEEAFSNGHVMDNLLNLSDVHGPRLTGSPEFQDAADWVVQQLKEWGISDAHLEPWGEFGRSWSLRRFQAHLVQPRYMPLIAFPKAWTSGTAGSVHSAVVYAPFSQSWEESPHDSSKILERVQK